MPNNYRSKVFGARANVLPIGNTQRETLFEFGLQENTVARSNDVNTVLREVSLITTSILAWIGTQNSFPIETPGSSEEDINSFINTFIIHTRNKVNSLIESRVHSMQAGQLAIAGGTNTINSSRAIIDRTSSNAIGVSTSIPTERTVNFALALINSAPQHRGINIFAPTTAGVGIPRRSTAGQWGWNGVIEGNNTFTGITSIDGALIVQGTGSHSSIPTGAIVSLSSNENTNAAGTSAGTPNARLNDILSNLSTQIIGLNSRVLNLAGGIVTGNIVGGVGAQLTGTWSGDRTLNGATTFGGGVTMNQPVTVNNTLTTDGLTIRGNIIANNFAASHERLRHEFARSSGTQSHTFQGVPAGVRMFILIISGPNGNQEHFTFQPSFRGTSNSANNPSFAPRTCELRENAISGRFDRLLFTISGLQYVFGDPTGSFQFTLGNRVRQNAWVGGQSAADISLTAELICL